MTDQGFRFCPRCGTALVAGQPYCPTCGFNVGEMAKGGIRPDADATGDAAERDPFDWSEERRPSASAAPVTSYEPEPRRSRGLSLVLPALIIAVGLIGYGMLTRPSGGQPAAPPAGFPGVPGVPVTLAPGATPVPSAPIVGITIQSPRDGEVVATQDVTVIGIAPPGLTITRDVSFGLDQHTTVDGTGHWAIGVRLNAGENILTFRIGDDRSTERKIRITFTAPAQ